MPRSSCPEHAGRPQLGDLHEKIDADRKSELRVRGDLRRRDVRGPAAGASIPRRSPARTPAPGRPSRRIRARSARRFPLCGRADRPFRPHGYLPPDHRNRSVNGSGSEPWLSSQPSGSAGTGLPLFPWRATARASAGNGEKSYSVGSGARRPSPPPVHRAAGAAQVGRSHPAHREAGRRVLPAVERLHVDVLPACG